MRRNKERDAKKRGDAERSKSLHKLPSQGLFVSKTDASRVCTRTLASRLSDMLIKAEEQYGKRDNTWTFTGIEFHSDGPCHWFVNGKGGAVQQGPKHIIIRLGLNAQLNDDLAIWQLAHECIHLISPNGNPSASVLEEGLATYFAEEYLKQERHGKVIPQGENDTPYAEACSLVRTLLEKYPDMIRNLRARIGKAMSDFTADDIRSVYSDVSEELARKLTSNFGRRGEWCEKQVER